MLTSDEAAWEALTKRGLGSKEHPEVSVELYGSLSTRTGLSRIAARADTINTVLIVLQQAYPSLKKLLGPLEILSENYRFSINGRTITTDPDTPLKEGDHLILFSASIGG